MSCKNRPVAGLPRFTPRRELADFVDYYFFYELTEERRRQHPGGLLVLPGTHARMAVISGEPTRMDNHLARDRPNPSIGVGGFFTGPVRYQASGEARLLIVGFKPYGLQPFLSDPIGDFADRNVDLRDWAAPEHARLTDEIERSAAPVDKVAAVERFLLRRLDRRRFDLRLGCLMDWIVACPLGSTRAVAAASGRSERSLRRGFHNTVGMAPKAFLRLARFQHAVRRLSRNSVAEGFWSNTPWQVVVVRLCSRVLAYRAHDLSHRRCGSVS